MNETNQMTEKEKTKAWRKLERDATNIARYYGHPIGFDALRLAAHEFNPTAKSFDDEGHLTCDAEHKFLQVMGENWDNVFDNVAGHVCQITRSELNIMRVQQGLHPV